FTLRKPNIIMSLQSHYKQTFFPTRVGHAPCYQSAPHWKEEGMISGLYSAASALDAAEQAHDITAHNIAHASVPGYRRRSVTFETFSRDSTEQIATESSSSNSLGVRASNVYTDFTPGDYQYTGNSLDLAVQGDGFFVLDGPNGPLYTRNGVFQLGRG